MRTFTAALGGTAITFASKPGLPHWDALSPASELLAETAELSSATRVQVMGSGHGALAAFVAARVGEGRVRVSDLTTLALDATEKTLQMNGFRKAEVAREIALTPEAVGTFDTVLIELPKGRKLIRRWLLEAHLALKPGGTLYLAGANDEGIQPAIADAAALFGGATQLGYRRRHRVAQMDRLTLPPPAPDWASTPGIAPHTWHELEVEHGGTRYALRSLPGVFSYDRLDDGTALLLSHFPEVSATRVLDFGCGYGILGIWAAHRGSGPVDLVDINVLAAASARENLALHGLQHAQVFAGDGLEPVRGRRYDLILANLPFHVGKAVDLSAAETLIREAKTVLAPGGRMVVVTNSFIRHDALLRKTFPHFRTVADNRRYRIVSVE
ncbi:MAG TPA: methyltransferase [Myxococcaceae bacterium]|nr:methyltransferase [Myxococcaceae bacterium]